MVIVAYSMQSYMDNDNESKAADFSNLPLVVGVALYSFSSSEMVVSLRNSMTNPIKFKRLLQIVNFYASILTIIFGIICSIGFGSDVSQIVIFSMPQDSIFVTLV